MDNELRFLFEWDDQEEIRTPELSATWARLELWAGDECITLVEDRRSGSSRRSVYGSLYPLGEWIAYNWWQLQAHARPAGLATVSWSYADFPRQHDWLTHHNLRAAGDGQAWPDLAILPEGTTTRLHWRGDESPPEHRPVRFLSQGSRVLPAEAVRSTLHHFVEAVVTRLEEEGLDDTPLGKEWAAIRATNRDEADFCIAAARLGLDPYTVEDAVAERIVGLTDILEAPLLEDFLDAVNPNLLDDGVQWVAAATQHLRRARRAGSAALQELRQAAPVGTNGSQTSAPWEEGWQRARKVRELLSIPPEERFGTDELVAVRGLPGPDPALQALGGLSPSGAALLVTGRSMRATARRFVQARALWHLIYRQQEQRFLVVAAHTDRQRMERAFAAELLAPAAGVRSHLNGIDRFVSAEQAEAVSAAFEVSPLLVIHQIENQLGLDVAAY